MSFFVSIFPSRSPTSTRPKPPFKAILASSLFSLPNPYHANATISVRPFPFTLLNARLPISSLQSCTSNGDKHTVNSPIEIICQCPSSMSCYQSGSGRVPVVRERAYSTGHVSLVNLHYNSLRECQALWMTVLRESRAGNVSWEGGGFKTGII
jgi:hypothetical protein